MADLKAIVKQLVTERNWIDTAIHALQGNHKRPTLSAAARKRIAEAQRARWAKFRRAKKAA